MGTDTQFDFVENGSTTSPLGFLACGVVAGLKKSKTADLAMIASETECNYAATFTSNLFPAAPVQYDREICATSKKIRAIVANSGVANACTGLDGYKNARRMAEIAAEALSIPAEQVLIGSTGRIGVHLPMELIENGIREAAKSLTHTGGSTAARAIMTTDTRPKELAVSFSVGDRVVTVGGMCKGAGMIAPNGHRSTQVKQPTHLFLSITTIPSSVLESAPAMQPVTHTALVQWRQFTAKCMALPSSPSTFMRGTNRSVLPLSLNMASSPEFAYMHSYSQR